MTRLLVVVAVLAVVLTGTGVAVAAASPVELRAAGPTSASGTEATAVFRVGDRVIRQVRYHDRGRLTYRFRLHNESPLPVTVTGLAPLSRDPRLFEYLRLRDADDQARFRIGPGESVEVALVMRMEHCETLSARAGSFATEVRLRTTRVGVVDDTVTLALPEEVHTGSPREAFCPRSTAGSRPPG